MKSKKVWFIPVAVILIGIIVFIFVSQNRSTQHEIYDVNSKPTIGAVELKVSDLAHVLTFYEDIIGLSVMTQTDAEVALTADGERELLVLIEDKEAIERPRGTTGLFHFAILLPTRQNLAVTFKHLMESGYPLEGASDHLYSEAIYLSDPEGNGIEIYADVEPSQWETDKDGHYITDSIPIDMEGIFAALGDKEWQGLPKDTSIGHMHLQMADLQEAEAFYVDTLGFEIVTEGPGMLFVSKDRYHHHIGMNTWAGTGLPKPPTNARGMNYFRLVFTEDEYQTAKSVLEEMDYPFEEREEAIWVEDPSGNNLKIMGELVY